MREGRRVEETHQKSYCISSLSENGTVCGHLISQQTVLCSLGEIDCTEADVKGDGQRWPVNE